MSAFLRASTPNGSKPPNGAQRPSQRLSGASQDKGQNVSAIEKAKPPSLGVKLGGSARKGHTITITREDALSEIFGTDDADQANGLLSHCLKALKTDEAGDAGAANDERHFLLSIVRDMAPRDPVERMLAVQMAATHVATIRSARWLANSDNLPQCQAHWQTVQPRQCPYP